MSGLSTNESLMVYFNFLCILFKHNLSTSSASKHKPNEVLKSLDKFLLHSQPQLKFWVHFSWASRLCQHVRVFFYKWPKTLMLCETLGVSGLYYWWSFFPLMVNNLSSTYWEMTCWLTLLSNMTPSISLFFIVLLTTTLKTFPIKMKRYENNRTPLLNSFSNWESWQWKCH